MNALQAIRIIRILNKFCMRSKRIIQNISLTLVEIIEITKSFLYMELEDCYFHEN